MKLGKLGKGAVRSARDVHRLAAFDEKRLKEVLGGQWVYNCNKVCGGEPCAFYPVERCPVIA